MKWRLSDWSCMMRATIVDRRWFQSLAKVLMKSAHWTVGSTMADNNSTDAFTLLHLIYVLHSSSRLHTVLSKILDCTLSRLKILDWTSFNQQLRSFQVPFLPVQSFSCVLSIGALVNICRALNIY